MLAKMWKCLVIALLSQYLWYWQYPVVLAVSCDIGSILWYWKYPVVLAVSCGLGSILWYWKYPVVLEVSCGIGSIRPSNCSIVEVITYWIEGIVCVLKYVSNNYESISPSWREAVISHCCAKYHSKGDGSQSKSRTVYVCWSKHKHLRFYRYRRWKWWYGLR